MNKQVKAILERNERVASDKAWETSGTRKLIIATFTYVIVVVFLIIIGNANPFVNALIPAIGYLLSTLSLPFVKKIWIEKYYKKK
mgnify:CR=1 FL=1